MKILSTFKRQNWSKSDFDRESTEKKLSKKIRRKADNKFAESTFAQIVILLWPLKAGFVHYALSLSLSLSLSNFLKFLLAAPMSCSPNKMEYFLHGIKLLRTPSHSWTRLQKKIWS